MHFFHFFLQVMNSSQNVAKPSNDAQTKSCLGDLMDTLKEFWQPKPVRFFLLLQCVLLFFLLF
jgi:hypothetical protein